MLQFSYLCKSLYFFLSGHIFFQSFMKIINFINPIIFVQRQSVIELFFLLIIFYQYYYLLMIYLVLLQINTKPLNIY